MTVGPTDDYETKARHLRRGYRHYGEAGRAKVQAEFDRLFPEGEARLDQILASAWIEARALAGWTYDIASQCWRRADGTAVVDDDGSELRGI